MTPRQKQVRDFVGEHIAVTGCSPSYQEIGEGLGIASKGHVHRLVARLLEQNDLVRKAGTATRTLALPGVDLSTVETTQLVSELEARGWHRG